MLDFYGIVCRRKSSCINVMIRTVLGFVLLHQSLLMCNTSGVHSLNKRQGPRDPLRVGTIYTYPKFESLAATLREHLKTLNDGRDLLWLKRWGRDEDFLRSAHLPPNNDTKPYWNKMTGVSGRMEAVVEMMEQYMGEIIMFTDINVVFSELPTKQILNGNDVLFVREIRHFNAKRFLKGTKGLSKTNSFPKKMRSDIINIGVMLMQVTPKLLEFFKDVVRLCKIGLWEQGVIGCMLNPGQRSTYQNKVGCGGVPDYSKNINWSFLPTKAAALCRPTKAIPPSTTRGCRLEYIPKDADEGGIKKIRASALMHVGNSSLTGICKFWGQFNIERDYSPTMCAQ